MHTTPTSTHTTPTFITEAVCLAAVLQLFKRNFNVKVTAYMAIIYSY